MRKRSVIPTPPPAGPSGIPPYRVRAKHAAAHVGIAVSNFYKLVSEGKMPAPRKMGNRSFWDLKEVEAGFDKIVGEENRT